MTTKKTKFRITALLAALAILAASFPVLAEGTDENVTNDIRTDVTDVTETSLTATEPEFIPESGESAEAEPAEETAPAPEPETTAEAEPAEEAAPAAEPGIPAEPETADEPAAEPEASDEEPETADEYEDFDDSQVTEFEEFEDGNGGYVNPELLEPLPDVPDELSSSGSTSASLIQEPWLQT